MGKFIPNGDLDFLTMAQSFARTIVGNPSAYFVADEDAQTLADAVQRYRDAFQLARFSGERSTRSTRAKEAARVDAERIIRNLATLIRANEKIDASAKRALNLRERPVKARRQQCPQEPPRLHFVQALHRASAGSPTHELRFTSLDFKSKPEGANRLELFVDLISPDEPIPTHPGDNHGGRPWYVRSYTRSPIRIVPPMAKVAMRVVYWARWADSTGNVGPFSASAVGWVEGGNVSKRAMQLRNPNAVEPLIEVEERPVMERDPTRRDREAVSREPNYAVAVIEAYSVSLMSTPSRSNALPAPEEDRQSRSTTAA